MNTKVAELPTLDLDVGGAGARICKPTVVNIGIIVAIITDITD